MNIETFKINIADEALADLQQRLRHTRWPQALDEDSWEDGTSLRFLKQLAAYWQDGFDWRAQEQRLNALPHFLTEIDGQKLHFIHCKGKGSGKAKGPDALPLVITHGWPGSFFEMERLIPLLTDPAAHGGDAADAFDVVVPSLPGYGFSQAPKTPGMGTYEIAGLWLKLMNGLGYQQFCAQGGDIGAGVSSWLAYRFPQQLKSFHLNFVPASYRPFLGDKQKPVTQEEQAYLDGVPIWAAAEGAYAHMQSTKSQTLAYGLTDSPIGLAAWIVEKFRSWSDCDGDVLSVFSMDSLLTDICLYWFSGTLDASLRLYKETRLRPLVLKAGERITPPLGVAHFPKELLTPPRSWVERGFNVTHWSDMPKGGHFAAMEQPERLAQDIRAHFRAVR